MATLQVLPQEIFKLVIEHVMDQQEPVDFDSFLLVVGQDSADDWRTASEFRSHEPQDLAAALSAEEVSPQSRIETALTHDPSHVNRPLWWRYRQRMLQDWRAASMQSRSFRAMGKIAFFEMKTFLITAKTAGLLQKSMIKQLSHRDQKTATERIRSIAFAIIKGFPSLSRVNLVIHGPLDNNTPRKREVSCREAPSEFKDVIYRFGVPISLLKISFQIHRTAEIRRTAEIEAWEDAEESLSRNVYPLLRTRARLLCLG